MADLVDATFVINLDSSRERMAFMAAQCLELDLPFERVSAVHGARLKRDDLEDVATPWCQKLCTTSMIGCALSHMKVWRMVVERGLARTLVMEDDAALVPTFERGLRRALQDVPEDFDILVLGCYFLCDKKRRYALGHELSRLFVPHSLRNDTRTWGSVFVPEYFGGSHCYVVSQRGARKLLKAIPKVAYHIDMQMNHPSLNIYAVSPDLAFQRDMADSTIASYKFPKTLVPVLETMKDSKRISVAYYLDAPMLQVGGEKINGWALIFALLGLIFRDRAAPYVAGIMLAEFTVGGEIFLPLVAYASGWLAWSGARRLSWARNLK